MKNNKLCELQSLSEQEITIEPYDYTCMIHLSYSELIIGRDGSGKTSLAIAQGVSYCMKRNITLLYVNADAKSAVQSNTFNSIFKDITNTTNCDAYHLNYYSWNKTKEGKGKSFFEFILMLAEYQKDEETYFIIDNWSKIINGFESDTKKVGDVIDVFERKISKIPNFTVVLLAHTGKNESLGARGMSSLRSVFGQEILIQVDAKGNRIGTITKDSEGNFRHKPVTYYIEIGLKYQLNFEVCEYNLIDKDVIVYHKEQRLERIVTSLLVELEASSYAYVEYAFLKSLVAIQGSKNLEITDPDYLSASFCSRNIGYVLEKLHVPIVKLKYKNNRNFVKTTTLNPIIRDTIGSESKSLIDVKSTKNFEDVVIRMSKHDLQNKDQQFEYLLNDVEALLATGPKTTQEIRKAIYLTPSVKDMKNYSKRYARDILPKVLDKLVQVAHASRITNGRKTTFTLIKECRNEKHNKIGC